MKKLLAFTLVWIVVASVLVGPMPLTIASGAAANQAVTVVDANLSTTEVTTGETATVTATVENTGDADASVTLELTADGTAIASTDVTVPANDSATATFAPSFDAAGSYELAVEGVVAGTLSVVAPPSAELTVVDATVSPTEVAPGESTTVTATVTNAGDAEGTAELSLTADGTEIATREVTVPANDSATATFAPSFDAAGSYELAVEGVAAGTLTVATPPSAEFEVVDAAIADDEMHEDTATAVTATVANTGDANGTATLELTAAGTVLSTTSVAVAAGESRTVTFTATFEDPGTYDIAVDGVAAGTLVVTDDPMLVEECTTITESGRYRIGEDLSAPADADACIVVAASDVVLEGQGHVLDGTSGYGSAPKTVHHGVTVSAPGDDVLSNVTVRNLVVTEWTHGIDLDGVVTGSVAGVTAEHNRVGVSLRRTERTTVIGGSAADNAAHGVRVRGHSTDVSVRSMVVADNGKRGVFVSRSDATTIAGNTIAGNRVGVFVRDVHDTTVRDNALEGNVEYGVLVAVADGTRIVGNDVIGGDVGVLVRTTRGEGGDDHGSDHEETDHDHEEIVPGETRIADNTFDEVSVGISLVGSDGAVLVDNEVRDAGTWALHMEGDAADARVSRLALGDDGTVSFTATDVGVRAPDDLPRTPDGHDDVGLGVAVAPTGGNASWNGLTVGYGQHAAETAGDESTLRLWHHDGSSWSLVGTPAGWHYDAARGWVATSIDGNGVDVESNVVRADTADFGVFAPLTGAVTTDAISVTDVDVEPVTVDDGEAVVVSAIVSYDGPGETTVRVDLAVDGAVVDSRTLNVTADEPVPVTFTPSFPPGNYALAVSGVAAGSVTVLDVTPPVADAGPDVTTVVGEPVEFDASGSSDDVDVDSYRWAFDDGTTDRGEVVAHAFGEPGTYVVELTVADAAGNTDTDTATVLVRQKPNQRDRSLVSTPSANISLIDATLDTPEVTTEVAVEVTATVENTGDADGEHVLELSADGTLVRVETVQVAVDETVTRTLRWYGHSPGEYELAVDGQPVGTVHVTLPATGTREPDDGTSVPDDSTTTAPDGDDADGRFDDGEPDAGVVVSGTAGPTPTLPSDDEQPAGDPGAGDGSGLVWLLLAVVVLGAAGALSLRRRT